MLKVIDADGVERYISFGSGDGSIDNPFSDDFVNDETNGISEQLINNGVVNQAVNGATTPQIFSSTVVPEGKIFIATRIIFYMESINAMNSNLFGDIPILANGWELLVNGVSTIKATQNRMLGQYMYDMQGVKIFGKEDKTMIGRLSFSKITPNSKGISIRAGETIATRVSDDLSGLVYLEATVGGTYIDA